MGEALLFFPTTKQAISKQKHLNKCHHPNRKDHFLPTSIGCLSQLVFKKLYTYIYTICVFSCLLTLSMPFFQVFVPKLYSQIFTGIPALLPPFRGFDRCSTLNWPTVWIWCSVAPRDGHGAPCATGTGDFFGRGRRLAGKSGDGGTDETKKEWGLDFWGCFLLFFVWFLCWKVFLWGDFCWGESWGKLDGGFKSLFSMFTLIWALIFSNGLKIHKKSWWELQHHFSSPYRIPGLVLMYLHEITWKNYKNQQSM